MRNGRQQGNDGALASVAAISAWWRGLGLVCLVLAVTMTSPAQDDQTSTSKVRFKVLVNIDTPPLGQNSFLSQGTDGNLYGMTTNGGNHVFGCAAYGCGTVYRMTPAGALTTIYNFCSQPNCADGSSPHGTYALTLGTDGNFYGTTGGGGATGNGTIFKITPSGGLTTLYNVCSQPNCADGSSNYGGVVLGADRNFYGTMTAGGAYNSGTVFKVTPQGAFATLYNFCSLANCADGASPQTGLVFGADRELYGMTSGGGASCCGTIYKITPAGKLTTLHSFDGTDGVCAPDCAPMVQAPDGNFYGVASGGGTGTAPPGGLAGVFFRITASGTYAVLYNFCSLANCADGGLPNALVYAGDRNFYGAALNGGNTSDPTCFGSGCGTLFKITPEGVLTTLHVFDGTTDGWVGQTLAQATNGIFYGSASAGGTGAGCSFGPFVGCGTIYALSAGLGPFVETLPTLGEVGETIQILSNDLTDATSVSFNGTAAAFTVDSKTLISATVPAGATTGFVTATGPNATLKSNVKFQVRR